MITSLGGTPVKPCTYNFGYKTADQFVTLAALLESTGVAAYDGALYQIQSTSTRIAAAKYRYRGSQALLLSEPADRHVSWVGIARYSGDIRHSAGCSGQVHVGVLTGD